jgi:hypothetical protein
MMVHQTERMHLPVGLGARLAKCCGGPVCGVGATSD